MKRLGFGCCKMNEVISTDATFAVCEVKAGASTEASSADRYDAVSLKSGTKTWINCVEGSDLQRRAEAIR